MSSADVDSLFTKPCSFCVLPWLQTYASIDGLFARCGADNSQFSDLYESEVKPAMKMQPEALGCIQGSPYAADNPDRVESLRSAFNAAALRRTRVRMLAGEPVDACAHCHHQEAQSGRSLRTVYNAQFADKFDWGELLAKTGPEGHVEHKPIELDLRLGNACNLHCQMCSFPVSSSWRRSTPSWHQGAVIDPYTKDAQFWADLRALAPHLQRISLAGGEPFLQGGHLPLLKLLIEERSAQNIHLIYTSNLTVLPKGVFELWPQFKQVSVAASCDGYGAVFEKIRCGGKWEVFAANVLEVKKRTTLKLVTTVQKDNLPFMDELVAWAHEIQAPLDLKNILTWPKSMSIAVMGTSELEQCHSTLARLAGVYEAKGNAGLVKELIQLGRVIQTLLAGRGPAPDASS